MKKIFITGGTGFVGFALINHLSENLSAKLVALVRREKANLPAEVVLAKVTTADSFSSNFPLTDVQVIIHCAARAHVMDDRSSDPLSEFRKVNVDGTLNLARQAAEAGVQRFIFISSIGVNGNINTKPFTAEDTPAPAEPYAQSKWEAEQGLLALSRETGMELVIIRPPLVHGPGAPGNFGKLVRWVDKGVPLPLGAIHNQRSLVALDNLVDLIVTCIDHPAAANQTFLVSDGEDLSTTELLRRMGAALGKPARLLPVPAFILLGGADLLGKREMAQRLCGSLQVDISKTRELLNWTPPVSVDEALQKTAKHFLEQHTK